MSPIVRKIILWVGMAIIAVLMGIILFAKDFEVRISEAEAQAKINSKIETENFEAVGGEVIVERADIDFRGDNTAHVTIKLDANILKVASNMEGDLATGIRYRAPWFYLSDITPGDLDVKMEQEGLNKFNKLQSQAVDFLERNVKTVDAETGKSKALKLTDSEIEALSRTAVMTIFTTIPIYDLNDAGIKGSATSVVLQEVRFEEDVAILKMSPRTAVLKFLMTFLIVVLIVVYSALPSLVIGYITSKIGKD